MKTLTIATVVLALAGCATAYAPSSFWNDGGFTETEVQPGLFMVRFVGNEFTSAERTADFAMLRAAELCLSRGAGFMYLGDVATRVVQTGVIPGSSTTTASATAYGTGSNASAYGTSHTTVTPPTVLYSPQTGLTVACATEKEDGAWDAAFLAQSMRKKYTLKSN
jgi:hypothetical protein